VANTLLAFRLGERLLKSRHAAVAAGILFAVHPIHNEAVVWIAALPDVLMTTAVLVSLLLFIRWDAAPHGRQIAALVGLFFLSLLTKEPAAMLVPLLAGYEFLYLGRPAWRASGGAPGPGRRTLWDNWALYASLMAVFGVYMLMRFHALGALAPAQGLHHTLHGTVLALSIIATLGEYLGKLVVPIHLNSYYFFEATTAATPRLILSLATELVLLCAIALLRSRPSDEPGNAQGLPRSAPSISYGLFLLLMPLAPVLNINGVGDNVFAERYLYLPSLGFVLVAAVGWEWLASRQRQIARAAVALVVAASAWILLPRNLDWHDDQRLLTVASSLSPKSGRLAGDQGWFYLRRGEYDVAIEKFQAGLRLEPNVAPFHTNLGNAYANQGRYQDAVTEFRKAIDLRPHYAAAYMGLGLALEAQGDVPGAVAAQQKALEFQPDYAEAYTALALIRMKEDNYPTAIDLLQRAIAANPRHVEAYINLGAAYNDTGRFSEASATFRKAIEVEPDHPNAYLLHYNLGMTYEHMDSPSAAALEFSKALRLRPDFAAARDALARISGTAR
jgi:tetratricopeptide (TPR) repeat protein